MTIGEKLRKARGAAVMTRKKVAEKTGISTSTIADNEQGKRTPNFTTVVILAHCYGVSVEFFVPTGNDLKELINNVKA